VQTKESEKLMTEVFYLL